MTKRYAWGLIPLAAFLIAAGDGRKNAGFSTPQRPSTAPNGGFEPRPTPKATNWSGYVPRHRPRGVTVCRYDQDTLHRSCTNTADRLQ